MVGKIFESKRTEGTTAKIIKFEEKFNTVVIEYLTGDKKGTSSSITTSTLKRWWKEIETPTMDEDSEVEEQIQVLEEEHKLVPMPGIEKLEELKKEYPKKKTKKSSIDRSNEILELDAFIGNTYNNKYYESVKCYKIIKDGKTIAEVYPRKKNIEVRVKAIKEDFDSDVLYKDGYKYYLPVHYFIEYSSLALDLIEDLLS